MEAVQIRKTTTITDFLAMLSNLEHKTDNDELYFKILETKEDILDMTEILSEVNDE